MIRPFIIGFATTCKHFFTKITVNYPDEKIPVFPKYRGKQVLMRDENGLEKCVACGLCAVACPADAIYLEAAGTTARCRPDRVREDLPDSQDALHLLRLLRRGLPRLSDLHGQGLRAAVYSNKDFIWDKADLLVPASTSPLGGNQVNCQKCQKCQNRRNFGNFGSPGNSGIAIWRVR